MGESSELNEAIARLKRCFHLKLAHKRGLSIDEHDLRSVNHASDDAVVQKYCERLSKLVDGAGDILGQRVVKDIYSISVRLTSRRFFGK